MNHSTYQNKLFFLVCLFFRFGHIVKIDRKKCSFLLGFFCCCQGHIKLWRLKENFVVGKCQFLHGWPLIFANIDIWPSGLLVIIKKVSWSSLIKGSTVWQDDFKIVENFFKETFAGWESMHQRYSIKILDWRQ